MYLSLNVLTYYKSTFSFNLGITPYFQLKTQSHAFTAPDSALTGHFTVTAKTNICWSLVSDKVVIRNILKNPLDELEKKSFIYTLIIGIE